MQSRKKRDAKFLIFQSLYIIAISILFYKGTDLSLVTVKDATDSTNTYLSPTETAIDTSLLSELSKNNAIVDKEKDSLIDRNVLAQITSKANENSKAPLVVVSPKTIIPTPVPPKRDEKKPEEKKKESDPDPQKKLEVTEFTSYPFKNPDQDRKMFVYQDGSMIGVVEPGKTKTIKIKKGGKIDYTFSN